MCRTRRAVSGLVVQMGVKTASTSCRPILVYGQGSEWRQCVLFGALKPAFAVLCAQAGDIQLVDFECRCLKSRYDRFRLCRFPCLALYLYRVNTIPDSLAVFLCQPPGFAKPHRRIPAQANILAFPANGGPQYPRFCPESLTLNVSPSPSAYVPGAAMALTFPAVS